MLLICILLRLKTGDGFKTLFSKPNLSSNFSPKATKTLLPY